MSLLEISNWYSQNLEQISISVEEGETLILLGSPAKKDIILGILGYMSGKQGTIQYNMDEFSKNPPWAVFSEDFLPSGISPAQWAVVFGENDGDSCENFCDLYLKPLNITEKVPLTKEYHRYQCALALGLWKKTGLLLMEVPDLEENEENKQWNQCLRDSYRLIQGEKCGKILSLPSFSALEPWMWEIGKIGIFSGKRLLVSGKISEMKLEKISCTIAQYKSISPVDYIWKNLEGERICLIGENLSKKLKIIGEFQQEPCELAEFMELIQKEELDSE